MVIQLYTYQQIQRITLGQICTIEGGTWETNNLTIATTDSSIIAGDTTSYTLNTSDVYIRVIYNGTSWEVNTLAYTGAPTTYEAFTGATDTADGEEGLVPAPVSGEEDYFLKGDGTWSEQNSTDTLESGTYDYTASVASDNFVVSDGTDDLITADDDGVLIKGYTGGSPSTGYIGEVLSNTYYNASETFSAKQLSLTLTPGVWIVNGAMKCDDATTVSGYVKLGINTTSGSFNNYYYTQISSDSENDFAIPAATTYYRIDSDTTIYLNYDAESSRTAKWYMKIWAMRIA